MSLSLLHRRADVGKSAREFFRFESASVRGRAHRRDLTRICLIAETSPALSFAARRTTMRIPSHRLRGGVVVWISAALVTPLQPRRPRETCREERQSALGRKPLVRGAPHSGLRYGREELRTVEDLIRQADVLLEGPNEDFYRPFNTAMRAFFRAVAGTGTGR